MFSSNRQKQYQTSDSGSTYDAITKKFSDELRKEIKHIKYPVLFSKGMYG